VPLAALHDPGGGSVDLLEGDRVARLGREAVVDEDDRGLRTEGQLAGQSAVGVAVAEDPAGAVGVQHDRQRCRDAGRAEDVDGQSPADVEHLDGRAGHLDLG
jgi:hypothetical protein